MENELKQKNGVNITVVILLIIVALLLGGIGGYCLYKSFDNNEEETKQNCIELNNCVVEYYSGSYSYLAKDEYGEAEIENSAKIPKLNVESVEAKKVNDAILDEYGYLIDKINEKKQPANEGYWFGELVEYQYYIKDDIVFICIDYTGSHYRGSGSADFLVYYYDVKNDKALTNTAVMNHFGITKKDINNVLETYYKESDYYNSNSLDYPIYPKDDKTFVIYFRNLGIEGEKMEITK